jgi:hypothetical protein
MKMPVSTLTENRSREEILRAIGIWPPIILVTGLITGVFVIGNLYFPLRGVLVGWFLLVCPGMAYARLLVNKDPLMEWVLAVGLSMGIDTSVVLLMLYLKAWSSMLGFLVIAILCVPGVVTQIVQAVRGEEG